MEVLRKQPELQCCRVLKCLALLRLGREEEAETILDKVNICSPQYIVFITIWRVEAFLLARIWVILPKNKHR